MIFKCLSNMPQFILWGLNFGWMVWKDCLSQNHGLLVHLYCDYVTFHSAGSCMFCVFGFERVNCTSFSHVTTDNLKLLKLCIVSNCVCFMRMFDSCLINVLLSLTRFSLEWYFLSLVSSWLVYRNIVYALTFTINDMKCSFYVVLRSSIFFRLIHISSAI